MRVLMLGWEFPPFISGGLGTACYGLTRGLDRLGTRVEFVLPRAVASPETSHVRLLTPAQMVYRAAQGGLAGTNRTLSDRDRQLEEDFQQTFFHQVGVRFSPYMRPEDPLGTTAETGGRESTTAGEWELAADFGGGPPASRLRGPGGLRVADLGGNAPAGAHYGGDLHSEIARYTELVCAVARSIRFEVIHAHDWMTFSAGIAVSRLTGKPLVVHVHSTEFDRSGLNINQQIYDIERAGVHCARRVIAVSHLTRNIIVKHYGVDARKVDVVYNAVDDNGDAAAEIMEPIQSEDKIVLFLGRITMQKGPEYFLYAAKRVLEVMPNVRFVMAGSGDMARRMIELSASLGIGHKVLFTGFLRGDDVKRVYRMADLYVMPSVSEPFGIAPLEAIANDVPVLISKQSGVAEVLTHALKVDFWDVDEMANKIVAVLRHPPLHATLRDHGAIEVRRFSWTDAAANCLKVYRKAVA
ncbi:Mannosylfructose-phosphate synthase [Phycisphaerae bacterium RAS1]|nr:Mannosylfructose-phosphate synthase [Phycisphaerae bacterium RAS1]